MPWYPSLVSSARLVIFILRKINKDGCRFDAASASDRYQ